MSKAARRLAHVCLGTRDLEMAVTFYCGQLGFRIVHEFRNDTGERYGFILALQEGAVLEFFLQREGRPDHGMFRHFCLEVDDIQATAQAMRDLGHSVDVTHGRTDNVPQFWITGPDGIRIEFHQYDETSICYMPDR